ncbi:MAG: peptidase M48 Ste24p, partial [Desulfovibrionaceae bacterium]|nr:peptidase M48 Ste24p [Desulfovibrionaceae bacterium]
ARAEHVSGVARIIQGRFEAAYQDFAEYDRLLPGNPGTAFLLGLCSECMGRRRDAARHYSRYLNAVQSGEQAQYAYARLVGWGYVRPARTGRR